VKKHKTTASAVDWNTLFSFLVIVGLSLLFWSGEARGELPSAGEIQQQLKILEQVDPQKAQQAREILESKGQEKGESKDSQEGQEPSPMKYSD